jgi:hypothetical protein
MTEKNIHADFKGYNAYPLAEADGMIRERFIRLLAGLSSHMGECSSKAKTEARIKLLSEINTIASKIERIQKDVQHCCPGYITPDIMLGTAGVDEHALMDLDLRMERALRLCSDVMSSMTCAETDIFILDKLASISGNLGEFHTAFHERFKLFKKEMRTH